MKIHASDDNITLSCFNHWYELSGCTIVLQTQVYICNAVSNFFLKNLPKSFSIINYVCLGYHHIHSAKQMLRIKNFARNWILHHVYFPPDLDFSDGANDTRASIIMSTWDNCLILGVFAWYRGFGNQNFVCYKKWQNCVTLPSFKGWPLHSCISINH